MDEFKRIKGVMAKHDRQLWAEAVKVLSAKKPKWLINEIRNDVGGHFSIEAGMRAVKTLRHGVVGS